jgi:hypothetical protein
MQLNILQLYLNGLMNLFTFFELFNISVAYVIDPSVTTFATDFSFQNLVFWNLFEFSMTKITLKSISHILNPNLTK